MLVLLESESELEHGDVEEEEDGGVRSLLSSHPAGTLLATSLSSTSISSSSAVLAHCFSISFNHSIRGCCNDPSFPSHLADGGPHDGAAASSEQPGAGGE